MLTGLTAPIVEDDCSFEHFLWTCEAHLAMWDDYFGPNIIAPSHPRLQERLDQYRKTLDEVTSVKKMLDDMTPEQFAAWWQRKAEEEYQDYQKAEATRKNTMHKMSAMYKKVEAWEPPETDDEDVSREHAQLKQVMLNQLQTVLDKNAKPYARLRSSLEAPDLEETRRKVGVMVKQYKPKVRRFERILATRRKAVAQLLEHVAVPETFEIR